MEKEQEKNNIKIFDYNVCEHHHEITKNLNELNNRFDNFSKIKWLNGDEKIIPLNKAVELILLDMSEIKKNTSLLTDSTKIFTSIILYIRKHKYFVTFIVLVIIFLINKNYFTDLISTIFNKIFL